MNVNLEKRYRILSQMIEKEKNSLVKDLCQLISVNTVNEGITHGKVCCRNKRRAFDFILSLARAMKLPCYRISDRGVVVEYGQGREVLAIPCHLDVVHAGEDWTHPPFRGTLKGSRIYGRGAVDNKGPCLSALYALFALKKSSVIPTWKIRLIYCCDEESGIWIDMDYCLRRLGEPSFTLVQDSHFPIVNSEKGFLDVIISSEKNSSTSIPRSSLTQADLTHFSGGLRSNMVPERAVGIIKIPKGVEAKKSFARMLQSKRKAYLKFFSLADIRVYSRSSYEKVCGPMSVKKCSGEIILEARGRSAHGSQPQAGRNAIVDLARFLVKLPLASNHRTRFVHVIAHVMKNDYSGKCFQIHSTHSVMGKVTVNLGQMVDHGKKISMTLNIRYPLGIQAKTIVSRIRRSLDFPVTVTVAPNSMKPFLIRADQLRIRQLQKAYRLATGRRASCVSMAGTTYAKLFQRAVGFGPLMPGENGRVHMSDEWISKPMLLRNTRALGAAYLTLACS